MSRAGVCENKRSCNNCKNNGEIKNSALSVLKLCQTEYSYYHYFFLTVAHLISLSIVATATDEFSASKMPPKKAPKKPAPPADPIDSITEDLDQLKVVGVSYSFDQKVPFVVKKYCKNDEDVMELEYMCLPMEQECFKFSLSEDGLNASITVATPEVFGEEKRMKKQMGDKYKQNDPRAVAHKNVVQEIRENGKMVNGKHWGAPQTVRLSVKCEGPPMKVWSYLPLGSYVDIAGKNGRPDERHRQFVLVISVFYKVAKKRIKKEKTGTTKVFASLSMDSDDSDVDANDDDLDFDDVSM